MAVSAVPFPITLLHIFGANSDEHRYGLEGASQTFLAGSLLSYTAGLLVATADDPTAGIVGVAVAPGQNATGKTTLYHPAFPAVLFTGALIHEANGTYTLAGTEAGIAYGMNVVNGLWYLDQSDTTGGVALVQRLFDPVGTVNGRVVFSFVASTTVY